MGQFLFNIKQDAIQILEIGREDIAFLQRLAICRLVRRLRHQETLNSGGRNTWRKYPK